MHRIDHVTKSDDENGAGKDGFTEGSVAQQIPATTVTADILNDIQEEICNTIESAGLTLAKGTQTQLRDAVYGLSDTIAIVADTDQMQPDPGTEVVRLNPLVAAFELRGVLRVGDRRRLVLSNVGTFAVTIKHLHASAASADRIQVPNAGDHVLHPGATAELIYDSQNNRWFLLGSHSPITGRKKFLTRIIAITGIGAYDIGLHNYTLKSNGATYQFDVGDLPEGAVITGVRAGVNSAGNANGSIRLNVHTPDDDASPGNGVDSYSPGVSQGGTTGALMLQETGLSEAYDPEKVYRVEINSPTDAASNNMIVYNVSILYDHPG